MIDKIMMGTYLAKKRRALGMTQTELSTKLHVSFQAVSKWERGLSLPDEEMLKKTYKVLGINEGLHIFEMASSMSLRDLIGDVNLHGITSENYISLGALVQSLIFSVEHVKQFNDSSIRKTLLKALDMKTELKELSLIRVSHVICQIFVDDVNIDEFVRQVEIIDETSLAIALSPKMFSYIITSKLARRVADIINGVSFIVSEDTNTMNIEYSIACSNDLSSKGFNCLYLRELCSITSIRRDVEAGTSGGGTFQQASLIVKKIDAKPSAVEDTINLIKQYLHQYKNDFEINLTF
ncbi:MAG: helix-turn-helix domain-containing protein [Firmicutes bacterium]|nr:helix-turn-helix domain-containing protein [Bacillota bacterium]